MSFALVVVVVVDTDTIEAEDDIMLWGAKMGEKKGISFFHVAFPVRYVSDVEPHIPHSLLTWNFFFWSYSINILFHSSRNLTVSRLYGRNNVKVHVN